LTVVFSQLLSFDSGKISKALVPFLGVAWLLFLVSRSGMSGLFPSPAAPLFSRSAPLLMPFGCSMLVPGLSAPDDRFASLLTCLRICPQEFIPSLSAWMSWAFLLGAPLTTAPENQYFPNSSWPALSVIAISPMLLSPVLGCASLRFSFLRLTFFAVAVDLFFSG